MSDDRSNASLVLKRSLGQALRALGSDLDRLDEAVADRVGLHRTDLRCLEIVAREGPISAGRLAILAGLSTSATTSVIDRVERFGYVRRTHDTKDRRRVLIEATAAAHHAGMAAFAGLMEGTDRLLTRYSLEELRLLDEFLAAIRGLVTDEAAAQAR